MKKAPTKDEEYIETNLKRLKIANLHLTQEVKILERRLDFMQDENARISLEQEALIKSMRFFTKVATDLMNEQNPEQPVQEKKSSEHGIG